MTLTNARATFGLNATATPTSTGVSGTSRIGEANASVSFPTANVAYCLRAILANSGDVLAVALTTGVTSGSTAWVAGNAQVETATITAAGGCTTSGNMALVVTSAGMSGSPLSVVVALTTAAHTTAALIATASRSALAANSVIAERFTVGGSGSNIELTTKGDQFTVPGGTLSVYGATDATLNLAIPAGLGVTVAGSSVNTTAGVASDGAKIYDNATDFEGVAIPTIAVINAVLIKNNHVSSVSSVGGTNDVFQVAANSTVGFTGADGYVLGIDTTQTFTATGISDLTITVIGETA